MLFLRHLEGTGGLWMASRAELLAKIESGETSVVLRRSRVSSCLISNPEDRVGDISRRFRQFANTMR